MDASRSTRRQSQRSAPLRAAQPSDDGPGISGSHPTVAPRYEPICLKRRRAEREFSAETARMNAARRRVRAGTKDGACGTRQAPHPRPRGCPPHTSSSVRRSGRTRARKCRACSSRGGMSCLAFDADTLRREPTARPPPRTRALAQVCRRRARARLAPRGATTASDGEPVLGSLPEVRRPPRTATGGYGDDVARAS